MKVSKSEMLKILDLVKPGLAKKEIIEQAAHFIFTAGEVVTFNDFVCISHPFSSDIEFSVPGTDFYKIVSGISEDEVDLSLKDSTLNIKAKGTKAAMTTILGEASKVTHLIDAIKAVMDVKDFWKPLPKEFTKGIHLCSFSASNDLSTGIRSCCAIHGDSIYTTDNIRASMYIMDTPMDDMMIPAKCVSDLVKYNFTSYGVSESWAHFRTGDDVIFSCKVMKGDYPYKQIEKLFPESDPTMTFPVELIEAVNGVSPMTEGDGEVDKIVTLDVTPGLITCKAQKERGWITKTVPTEYAGEAFQIMINPAFFVQILRQAANFALLEKKGFFSSDNFFHILSLPMEN